MQYQVNVRAVVTGEKSMLEDIIPSSDWEFYDFSSTDDEGNAEFKGDTLVTVEADNKEQAIKLAKDSAPGLGVNNDQVGVSLWVDESIDVTEIGRALEGDQELLFGVTDQHIVIPLKVVGRESVEGDIKIRTEIAGESNSHTECHHKHYFKYLWLDEKGIPNTSTVFTKKEDAIAEALKGAKDFIESLRLMIELKKERILHLESDNALLPMTHVSGKNPTVGPQVVVK